MKNVIKVVSQLFILLVLVGTMAIGVMASEKNVSWTYDADTKVLTISGTGKVTRDEKWNKLEINHVEIEEGIKKIDRYAFSYMNDMKTISIPTSVQKIGLSAFEGSGLEKITIEKTVKKIDGWVFYACKNLEEVVWNTEKIPRYAFYDCKNLKTIKMSEDINCIGQKAFSNTGIKEFTIPNTIKEIGESVFENCKKLEVVNWNLEEIPRYTFYRCKALKTVNLSSELHTIKRKAFTNTAIETFIIPDSVNKIEDAVFSNCKKLEQLTFSKNIDTIPSNIVKGCKKLNEIVINEGTTTIGAYAFANCKVNNIVIPTSVTKIKAKAFYGTKGIKEIIIPNEVKRIRDYTFYNCTDLENVVWGEKIRSIGESAFENCNSLGKITIPGNIKSIEYKAFANSGCTELLLLDGVEEVDYWVFNNCDRLETVTIGSTVSTICDNAFVDCDKLTQIIVDENNKEYASEEGCLLNKDKTELLMVPGGKIGDYEIPASVTKINSQAFYSCKLITNILSTNNKNFASVDGILYNSEVTQLISCPINKTGTITIPSTVTSIGTSAFQNSYAKKIIIPDSVVSIGQCAFEYCQNLKEIKIPGSVKKISQAAFWGCSNLKKVVIENGTKKIQRNAFNGCSKLKKIVIPISVYFINETAFSDCYKISIYCKKSSCAMSFANRFYYKYRII